MSPDPELLIHYLEKGDEAAFAEVVRRNVDLVYSAAVTWVQALPPGRGRDQALTSVMSQMATENPAQAWNMALTLSAGATTDQILVNTAIKWARLDSATALATVENTKLNATQRAAVLKAVQRVVEPPAK